MATARAASDPAADAAHQRVVRRHNLSMVMRHLVERGPRSRATISASIGLNKSTVSSLVAELIDLGLLRQTDVERPGARGRPAYMVEIDGRAVVGLGMEIHAGHICVQAVDLAGAVRYDATTSIVAPSQPADVLSAAGAMGSRAVTLLEAQGCRVVGCVLAVPGLVDPAHGSVVRAPTLGWVDVAATGVLQAHLPAVHADLSVENEANLAALAELWEGIGREHPDLVLLYGDVGVGGAIVIDGALLRGAGGASGEIGHVVVDPGGARCGCGGRGCLETVAGLPAILAAAGPRAAAQGHPAMVVLRLVELARRADAEVLAALATTGRWLAVGLADLLMALDPQAVVLAGIYAPLAPWLEPALREELAARMPPPRAAGIIVVASHLGADAALRGAALSPLRALLADPWRARDEAGVAQATG